LNIISMNLLNFRINLMLQKPAVIPLLTCIGYKFNTSHFPSITALQCLGRREKCICFKIWLIAGHSQWWRRKHLCHVYSKTVNMVINDGIFLPSFLNPGHNNENCRYSLHFWSFWLSFTCTVERNIILVQIHLSVI
jgi:hypothetical protein